MWVRARNSYEEDAAPARRHLLGGAAGSGNPFRLAKMLPLVFPLAFGGSVVACFACFFLAAFKLVLALRLDSTGSAADDFEPGGGGGSGGGGGDGSVFSTDASSCSTVNWLDEAAPGSADCASPFIARRTGLDNFVVIFCDCFGRWPDGTGGSGQSVVPLNTQYRAVLAVTALVLAWSVIWLAGQLFGWLVSWLPARSLGPITVFTRLA